MTESLDSSFLGLVARFVYKTTTVNEELVVTLVIFLWNCSMLYPPCGLCILDGPQRLCGPFALMLRSLEAVVMMTDIASRLDESHLATSSGGEVGRTGSSNSSLALGSCSITRDDADLPIRKVIVCEDRKAVVTVETTSASDIARINER